MADFNPNFFDHLIMIIIGIFLPAMAIASSRQNLSGIKITPQIKKTIYWSNSLILWIGTIVVIAVWFGSGRSFEELGLAPMIPDPPNLAYYLITAFILLYGLDTIYHVHSDSARKNTLQNWKKHTPFLPENWNEFLWFLIVAFTAGICEEIIYRGYMINYLMVVFRTEPNVLVWAVMIPALVFGVAHIYQGWLAVIKVIMMAMLFGYFFVFTESILVLIILHILVDIAGGLISLFILDKPLNIQSSNPEEE